MAPRATAASPKATPNKQSSMDAFLSSKKGSASKVQATEPDDEAGTQVSSAAPTPSGRKRKEADQEPNSETSPEDQDKISNSNGKKPRVTQTQPSQSSRANQSRPNRFVGRGYEPPSTYEHLPPLPDTLIPDLICVTVGLNPGIQTATKSWPYAHPTNLYWPLLHLSGLTPDRRLHPSEYTILPEQYSIGNTNIVGRATRDGSQLSKEEMVEGAAVLDEKIRKWKPECVCLVGKSIWEAVWKWKTGRNLRPKDFKYGFQDAAYNMGKIGNAGLLGKSDASKGESWAGARVFVATTTSALAAGMSMQQKKEIWEKLGDWTNKRREERKQVKASASGSSD